MTFATLDQSRIKGGTSIAWCWWPGSRGETLTTIRGCKWARYFDAAKKTWVYYDTCANCYAQATAHSLCTRFNSPHYAGLTKATKRGPIWTGKVRFDEEQLLAVLSAKAPRTYFLTSMGDLFYEAVSDEIIAKHVAVMTIAQRHRFLVLTKRPDRMAQLLNEKNFVESVRRIVRSWGYALHHFTENWIPPQNCWWGTSIENKASAKWALDELVKIDAPGRLWTSFEPMLEHVNLRPWLDRLSWVVLGGASKQSAADAPGFDLDDAEAVAIACRETGTPLFIKQLGARPVQVPENHAVPIRLPVHDNHNADPQHWPAPLRIQQFPVPA